MLLCKHDECEHKKRPNFYTQYKISTAFCDFIPKCRSLRIVDMVKDKKKNYQNKNNKRKQKTTTTKRKKYYCQAGIRTMIACVESEDHIWLIKRSMRCFCEFLFIIWGTSSDNILRFLANSNFLNQQKGRGSLSVRKMNLRSHETSVSIVTQAICTGIF